MTVRCDLEIFTKVTDTDNQRAVSATQYPDYDLGPEVIQYIMILVAPALLAASIYMEFGRLIIMTDGDRFCFIRRTWLTKIFVIGDIISFLAQFSGTQISVFLLRPLGEKFADNGRWCNARE